MNREDILPYVYYKGEVFKRAGLNIIKNVALKIPIFKFFHDNIIAPFSCSLSEVEKENSYMEQIVKNIERKKKEKENKKFERLFPDYTSKVKPEIEKEKSKDLKEIISEVLDILEK